MAMSTPSSRANDEVWPPRRDVPTRNSATARRLLAMPLEAA
jgi:hypothetical protein